MGCAASYLGGRCRGDTPRRRLSLLPGSFLALAICAVPVVHATDSAGTDAPLADVFGFTVSTADLPGVDEREITWESVPAIGGDDGPGALIGNALLFGYGLSSSIAVTTGLLVDGALDVDDAAGNGSRWSVNGAIVETRFEIVERRDNTPGIAVLITPAVAWRDGETGASIDSRSLEVRLAGDTRLSGTQYFAAFNAAYAIEEVDPDEGDKERGSDVELSAALTRKMAANWFVGGEARYFETFDGFGLGDAAGRVLFIGPSLFFTTSSAASVTLAWSAQVWGKAEGQSDRRLDLANFDRHELKMKVAVPF